MYLPDVGEVVTPADDPFQFNPAWRSIVAGHLFASGARTGEDLLSISRHGCVLVPRRQAAPRSGKDAGAKGRKGGQGRQVGEAFSRRRIQPFDSRPEYRPFASDPWISALVNLYEEEASGLAISDASVPVKLATRWYLEQDHEAAMKKRIEPLLLTEAEMDVVALDLTGSKDTRPAFEAYERLYFNCRDDLFRQSPSLQLVQRMAMPWGPLKTYCRKWEAVDADGFVIGDGRPLAKDSDVWRAVAATMGYEALMYVWRWDRRAHGMSGGSLESMIEASWRVAVSKLFIDLFNGDIKHEDAARLLSAYTAQAKKISDDRAEGGDSEGEESTMALLAVLSAAAPKMREIVAGGEGAITDGDIRSRIESQLSIDKTRIQDKGREVEAEVIDSQIESALNME